MKEVFNHWWPFIQEVVKAVEEMVSPDTSGAAKKVIALNLLKQAAVAAGITLGGFWWWVIGIGIELSIRLYHYRKEFVHQGEMTNEELSAARAAAPVSADEAGAMSKDILDSDPELAKFLAGFSTPVPRS